jgi:hypothetical protein
MAVMICDHLSREDSEGWSAPKKRVIGRHEMLFAPRTVERALVGRPREKARRL